MSVQPTFFYIFASLAVLAAAMVIVARNPVHAVLFLILAFFNAAGLFVLLGAEFLAMLLVIVYVGAVAVLFLFVVMMLDVDFAELRAGYIRNAPLGLIIGGIVALELIMVLGYRSLQPGLGAAPASSPIPDPAKLSNTAALGQLIYTKYIYLFQAAGLILLVAMIGAIVLTLRHKEGVRRQSISAQNARTKASAMAVVKVASGETGMPVSPAKEAAE